MSTYGNSSFAVVFYICYPLFTVPIVTVVITVLDSWKLTKGIITGTAVQYNVIKLPVVVRNFTLQVLM